jgi:methionine-rich copper-binding protein CopC
MTHFRTSFLTGAALVTTLAFAGEAASPPVRHLALERSVPGPDSLLTSAPTHVVLWFNQEPNTRVSAVTLADSRGAAVRLGPVTGCPTDKSVIHAKIEEPLAPGRYTVAWRTAGADGHVVRGEFHFRVR